MAGPVRHPIDQAALERYLERNVPEIQTPVDVKQFGFGQSNPTYQLKTPTGRRFVLRKKPPGKLLSPTAHQVEREHRILAALAPTDVPVPRTFGLCVDDSVVGTPFYLMEFLDGRIFTDASLPDASAPEERSALWRAAARTLARLHRVRPGDVGLGDFGRQGGFYARQLRTWSGICRRQAEVEDVETGEKVGQLPRFEELVRFFGEDKFQPRDWATLVHGDYKMDNLVFAKDQSEVIGILDWEMSTIGHPLADLANLLTPFYTARSLDEDGDGRGESSSRTATADPAFLPGATPGLPDAEDVVRWYAELVGFDPAPDLAWAVAFSMFRNAGVCQGIAARVARRQASSAVARVYAETRGALAELAWELACQARDKGRPARL